MTTFLSSGSLAALPPPELERHEQAAGAPATTVHAQVRAIAGAPGPGGTAASPPGGLAARIQQHRRLRAAAYGDLRALCAAVVGCAPGQVRVQARPGAAPRVHAPQPLVASLSHTRGWVAVAVTRGPHRLGVDVQAPLRPARALEALAASVLSDLELHEWTALPREHRAGALLRSWTYKEAVLKALGVGLAEDPRQVCTSPTGRLRALPVGGGDPRSWTMASWQATSGLSAATLTVAVDVPNAAIEVDGASAATLSDPAPDSTRRSS